MTIDDIVQLLTKDKSMPLKDKCTLRKKVISDLKGICDVSDTAIRRWDKVDHIPDERIEQIKDHYKLS